MASERKDKAKAKRRENMIFAGMAALAAVAFAASLCVGRYAIPPQALLSLIMGGEGGGGLDASVFFSIRLPRTVAALLIGMALSMSGAAYQGTFRNPIVSPDLLGATAGASFGAALAIFLGLGKIALQCIAFGFGLVGVAISYLIGMRYASARRDGATTLILCGMVITAIFSACISIVKLVADPYDELPTITFWLMGGLSYVVSDDVWVMLAPVAAGGVLLWLMRFRLNVLSLPDEEANALGVDAARSRGLVVLCATLLTSGAVAVGGMIGWVGLIVPHIARLAVGPDYRRLLPASLLIGAAFLPTVDDFARTLLDIELPLGVLTAVIGAPLFLWLLAREGAES